MLPSPAEIKAYYVYEYSHLDDLSFVVSPFRVFTRDRTFEHYSFDEIQAVVDEVEQKFIEIGWEGDGEIGIIWLPPFVDIGIEDTWGNYLWHVKQSNNGISYILSAGPLEFKRIKEQNNDRSWLERGAVAVSIINSASESLKSSVNEIWSEYSSNDLLIKSMQPSQDTASIKNNLLVYTQGVLVGCLQSFLDGCYLSFLIEVIDGGNRAKIKIRKSKVQLNTNRYIPDDIEDEEANTWFTLKGIISDMWKAYKFEPYKLKMEMLFTAVDFSWEPDERAFLSKHVSLRNCIQHHEGRLDADSLHGSGAFSFNIKGPTQDIHLNKWDKVIFTNEELAKFCEVLKDFADKFDDFVFARIPAHHYALKK